MTWSGILGFLIVLVSGGAMGIIALISKKKQSTFREISAFIHLRKAIGLSVEDGSRLHFSLGHGGINTPQGASGLAGLSALLRVSDLTSTGDLPPIASSGEGALSILTQDTLQASYKRMTVGGHFDMTTSRLCGLSPFSYAAGVIPVIHDENVSSNILIGRFGIEAGLLTDSAERIGSFILAASDSLPAQSIFYASAYEPLIGEELFTVSAYLKPQPMHAASLQVQDIMRWMIAALILIGALISLIGLL